MTGRREERTVPTNGSARRWVKRIGLGLVMLLVAAMAAGAALQAVADWRGARRFPQDGRSVALGGDYPGTTLNLNCTGTGSPTVILDSGLGLPAATWELVQRDVATFTRVCSYDRAGYGWSSELPMPRTSGAVARELHALLAASRESAPYVLVGHSFGGYNVRVYTSRYPTDVAGLVLVDASQEDADGAEPASMKKSDEELRATLIWQRTLAPVLIRIGVARFVFPAVPLGKLSEETREKVAYLNLQSKFARAAISELEAFSQSGDEVRATGTLGNRPLVVLTAGQEPDGAHLQKGVSLAEARAFHQVWVNDLQVRLARLSTRGRQVIVPDSNHGIPVERPDAVAAAIRDVCGEVRNDAVQTRLR